MNWSLDYNFIHGLSDTISQLFETSDNGSGKANFAIGEGNWVIRVEAENMKWWKYQKMKMENGTLMRWVFSVMITSFLSVGQFPS